MSLADLAITFKAKVEIAKEYRLRDLTKKKIPKEYRTARVVLMKIHKVSGPAIVTSNDFLRSSVNFVSLPRGYFWDIVKKTREGYITFKDGKIYKKFYEVYNEAEKRYNGAKLNER